MRVRTAEKLIARLEEGQGLRCLLRKGLARHVNVMGRGVIIIYRNASVHPDEEYSYKISDTVWEKGVWKAQGAWRGGAVSRKEAVELLAYYGDAKTVRIW